LLHIGSGDFYSENLKFSQDFDVSLFLNIYTSFDSLQKMKNFLDLSDQNSIKKERYNPLETLAKT